MIDRDVCCPLLEVVHRVAAVVHDPLDQRVRSRNRASRVVYEKPLRRLPLLDVTVSLLRRKGSKLELLAPLLSVAELSLGLALAPGVLDGAVVLPAKPVLQ